VERQAFSGKAAIAGVGYTRFSRESGRTVLDLTMEAVHAAVADAGLQSRDVDGLLSYALSDSVPTHMVARMLGLADHGWTNDYHGGGSQAAAILGDAAMVVAAGLAETVVVYRSLNGRSGKRMGQISLGSSDGMEEQFLTPYGFRGPVNLFALAAQRYLHDRGLAPDALGPLVVRQRAKAVANPKALLRDPLTIDDYRAAPMIASPLRRLDCCLETDAACAIVVTTPDRARALRNRPVHILGAIRAGGRGAGAMDKAGDDPARIFSAHVAPRFYAAMGVAPADIDLVQCYDAYSYLILQQLEDFGFLAPGEVADFAATGEAGRGFALNTNGGLLSEGYVHGLNNVVEAVEQLQGKAGDRQVDAATALCTGFGGNFGSALLLGLEA
jgi:acetyl-CoA acetyltransferase